MLKAYFREYFVCIFMEFDEFSFLFMQETVLLTSPLISGWKNSVSFKMALLLLGALNGRVVIETNVPLLFSGELYSGHCNVCCHVRKY
jgi:hypothetical protein